MQQFFYNFCFFNELYCTFYSTFFNIDYKGLTEDLEIYRKVNQYNSYIRYNHSEGHHSFIVYINFHYFIILIIFDKNWSYNVKFQKHFY